MLRVGSSLIDYDVEAADGILGSVHDILFDDVSWRMRWLVINYGDFLHRRRAVIHPSVLGLVDANGGGVQVKIARSTIEAAPGNLLVDKLTMRLEANLFQHYDLDPAWGSSTFGASTAPTTLSDDIDPHLCSLSEAIGRHVHARDGNIGHLEDVLIDDLDWLVYYLIINTGSWWAGQHVLVSPHAITSFETADQQVSVDTTRAKILSSPPWKPDEQVDAGYQAQLHNHYGWPGS